MAANAYGIQNLKGYGSGKSGETRAYRAQHPARRYTQVIQSGANAGKTVNVSRKKYKQNIAQQGMRAAARRRIGGRQY